MTEIAVPKLNNNDESYTLVDWLFDDGDLVPDGEDVVTVETSKAAEDLPCPQGGILHRLVAVSQECRPGEIIGRLFATEADRQNYLAEPAKPAAKPTAEPDAGLVVTEAARTLARQHGIDEDQLRALGKTIIKSSDVQALLAAETPQPAAQGLDRTQQAIAAVVSKAHREIPAAFTVFKVAVDAVLELATVETERAGYPVGVPEFVIKAMAGLHEKFPTFFATLTDAGLVAAQAPGIGVTVDVGKGLFIPVLPDPARRSVADIAETLMDYRIKAMRAAFREQDFAGASIVLSLNNDDGVLFARPIIFPGQVAMVSLGAVMDELTLTETGEVARRRVAHLGLTYDHRVINGRDAVLFGKQLSALLADPATLSTVGGAA